MIGFDHKQSQLIYLCKGHFEDDRFSLLIAFYEKVWRHVWSEGALISLTSYLRKIWLRLIIVQNRLEAGIEEYHSRLNPFCTLEDSCDRVFPCSDVMRIYRNAIIFMMNQISDTEVKYMTLEPFDKNFL